MNKNLAFPNWITANKMIEHIVDNMFGLVVESTGTNVTLHFIPAAAIDLVPIDDRKKFQTLYTVFLRWLRDKQAIPDMERYLYMPKDRRTHEQIRHYIMNGFAMVEAMYRMSVPEILKGVLGVPPHAFRLPEELKKIYEGDNWRVLDRSDLHKQPFNRLW